MMKRVLGKNVCDIDFKVKDKGPEMYFLVNAPPPKLLDVAISNFAGA